jgi:hypothetical protein
LPISPPLPLPRVAKLHRAFPEWWKWGTDSPQALWDARSWGWKGGRDTLCIWRGVDQLGMGFACAYHFISSGSKVILPHLSKVMLTVYFYRHMYEYMLVNNSN